MDKLVLVDTHAIPDAQRDNLAPDISIYAADNVPDANTKTDFSKMELFVEFKFAETSDPFRDPLQPRAENFRFENDSDVSQLNRGQLCSYAAAHTSTPSPYRYADHLQDLFVGIGAARLLPGASTTLNNRISLLTSSGITHISIIVSADTILPSHQHRRRISNRSGMSKTVCGKRIQPIVNSV